MSSPARTTRLAIEREAAVEAYVQRLLADAPPLSEGRKLRLSRLLTPPRQPVSADLGVKTPVTDNAPGLNRDEVR